MVNTTVPENNLFHWNYNFATIGVVKNNPSGLTVYGLKQARRKWYDTLSELLTTIGFQKSMADPVIFFMHVENDMVILFIHVNNTIMTGSSINLIRKYEQQIGEVFEITHLGPISWLLGLAIT